MVMHKLTNIDSVEDKVKSLNDCAKHLSFIDAIDLAEKDNNYELWEVYNCSKSDFLFYALSESTEEIEKSSLECFQINKAMMLNGNPFEDFFLFEK